MTTTTQTTEAAVTTTTQTDTTPAVIPTKAPKAKKSKVQERLDTLLTFEPGIVALKVEDIEAKAETNTTRSDVGIDPKYVEELAASIKALGLQNPIVVQRVKGEFAPYRVVSGFCRLAAVKSLGLKTIDARVEVSGSERARVLGNVAENMSARKEVTALGAAIGVEALVTEGFTMAEVAEFLGKAEDYVRDLARISKGADEVREALKLGDDHENGVTWAVARLVLRFAKGEQAALLKKVQKLSVVKAREVLAEYRAEKSGKKTGSEGSENSEGGEGGEETGSESRDSKTSKHDVVIPEGKVIKATVPFHGTFGVALAALREALANGDIGQAEKVANVMAKAIVKQERALRALLGDKVYEAAEKAAEKAAEE